jgi:D-serine deaminase-like pyridoxal phosphate-dependent protein
MVPEEFIGAPKGTLDTPCLCLDLDILERNIRTMEEHAAAFGKKLRPHAKTHKCSRLARRQMEAGAVGICAAKVGEAEVLVRGGIKDVLITSPVVTESKIRRLLDCLASAPQLTVVVDNAANARHLNDAAKQRGMKLGVLVDLDPGMGRTGVNFLAAPTLGRWIRDLPHLKLRGVQCYAGHIQHVASFPERTRLSREWMEKAAAVFRLFQEAGLGAEIFTGTGTGTFEIDCRIPELTDMQVGSYALMDAEYIAIGSSQDPARLAQFPPALTLLATVVSSNHNSSFVTVDAGLKALYHHGGTPFVLSPQIPGLRYEWRGDEHGQISYPPASRKFDIGEVLELVVSHVDPTVNLFDVFFCTRNGTVTDVWPIDLRGKGQ